MLYVFDFIDLAKRGLITPVGEIRRYPNMCFPFNAHPIFFYFFLNMIFVNNFIDLAKRAQCASPCR